MAQSPQIELAVRKQMLLAESEECRRQLAHELEELRAATEWVDQGIFVAQQVKSWLPFLAPLKDLLFTGQPEGSEEKKPETSGRWLRFGRRLMTAWLRR